MLKTPSIKSYFDEKLAKEEKDFAFSKGLIYAGHEKMVPEKSSYQVLPHFNDRYVLFNQGDNHFELLSNVCTHRQAKLLSGCGKTKNIVCGVHSFCFDTCGNLKAAPFFDKKPEGKLDVIKLEKWNGLLFKGRAPKIDLKALGLSEYLDFDNYVFSEMTTTTYGYNWKSFLEVYLENYHVFQVHPGLKKYVSPGDLEWEIGDDYSIQKVGIGKDLTKETTPLYKDFQNKLIEKYNGDLPKYGAIWTFIYPNIMLEWYPGILVISTIYPNGARSCTNHVEYYYDKKSLESFPEYYKAHKKAYEETAKEDEVACLLLESGREALYRQGEEAQGIAHPFLELGVIKFYEFLER